MPQVSIKIALRDYILPASEEDIPHIKALASRIDARVGEIKRGMPHATSEQILVMLLLILQDEIEASKNANLSGLSPSGVDFAPLAKKLAEYATRLAKLSDKLK
jgi:cell division protein ZapA (FtsZ GTPase activity inhibitor)